MPWWGYALGGVLVLGLMYLGVRAIWGVLTIIWRLKWVIAIVGVGAMLVWSCASVFR